MKTTERVSYVCHVRAVAGTVGNLTLSLTTTSKPRSPVKSTSRRAHTAPRRQAYGRLVDTRAAQIHRPPRLVDTAPIHQPPRAHHRLCARRLRSRMHPPPPPPPPHHTRAGCLPRSNKGSLIRLREVPSSPNLRARRNFHRALIRLIRLWEVPSSPNPTNPPNPPKGGSVEPRGQPPPPLDPLNAFDQVAAAAQL